MLTTATLRVLTRSQGGQFRSYSSSLRTAKLPTSSIYRPQFGSKHGANFTPHNSKRSFSLSAIVDTAISHSESLLLNLHATTGLPWYLTIPLFAVAFSFVRLPSLVYLRHADQKMKKILPLLRASIAAQADSFARRIPHPGSLGISQHAKMVGNSVKGFEKGLRKEVGLQFWKLWAAQLAPLPIWLLGHEAVRRLCGGSPGLLSFLTLNWWKPETKPGSVDTVAQIHSVDGIDQAQGVVAQVLDPSLTTEGFLWFTDLTAADPFCALPFILSGMLLVRLRPWSGRMRKAIFGIQPAGDAVAPSISQKLMARTMFLLAICAGPITMNLPAGLQLYWISTFITTELQTRAIGGLMPATQTPRWTSRTPSLLIRPTRETPKMTASSEGRKPST
ncbi:hypothetical protein QBC42DRAFT_267864 [Cladorrhinum samala]|uniref:Uncharacterized protein n=1 Tax=Cladorrhinum samala TaxID=585594 RepID=A0AAV9HQT8_9PEZI|nr:hypothetical protein QBC42DRAFT_267864 [Cladorrhinum samala]